MTYQPQPGTVPYRVITWLKLQPTGAEFPSAVIAEELGIIPSHIPSSLEVPAKHGAIAKRKEGALIMWSLGNGKPLPLPFDLERDEPLEPKRERAPKEVKPMQVPVFLKSEATPQPAPQPVRECPSRVEVIERLRSAALSHGEVADLLQVLGECFAFCGDGDTRFVGDASDLEYLKAVVLASEFTAYDRGEVAKEGV